MTAGCGTHTADIFDRYGALVAHCNDLTAVVWNRSLNDVSSAQVTVSPSGDCCERLRNVTTWRHKLVIWRNGRAVWEGPIQKVLWQSGGVSIDASDILAWLNRRVPHHDRTFTRTDLTDIAEWLIADGFAPDDPGHEVMVLGQTGIRGDREYTKDVGQTWEHLGDLSDTGLDITAVGSTILLLPEGYSERVGALSDIDLPDGLGVTSDGATLVTRWVVRGSTTGDGDGEPPGEDREIIGEAGGVDPYWGLLERTRDDSSILDNVSATAAAQSWLRATSPEQLYVSTDQVTLSPDAPVDVPLLVPGWCLDVATTATCKAVQQRMKIVGLQVSEDPTQESVKVQLSPVGGPVGDLGGI